MSDQNNAPTSAGFKSAAVTSLPSQHTSVLIFGASGDLTARKLMPALFMLARKQYLPAQIPIIGVARRDKSSDLFRDEMRAAVANSVRGGVTDEEWTAFAQRLHYVKANLDESADFTPLRTSVEAIEQSCGGSAGRTRIVYLATDPKLFLSSVQSLSRAGMIPSAEDQARLRVVFEKPFGRDLKSAQEISHTLGRLLREDQVYRIDHYLGKETVQNILLFRFGNSIFEPLLSRTHVDHVQITVAESQGIESGRGGYYDKSGALRDVLQNHVLQLLCLIAMEPPARFQADAIRDEKLKLLQCLSPGDTEIAKWAIPGQFAAGTAGGKQVPGYLNEDRIPPDSCRETYVAMKVAIDNWRWAGVPFFLRTGKRLPSRVTEIAIQFKQPPLHHFSTVECDGDMCQYVTAQPNTLVFRIQPSEAILLSVASKRPGMQYQIHPVTMDFQFEETFGVELPEAYERLLLDVLRGDSTLFTRSDELEEAWRFVMPVLDYWENGGVRPEPYAAGTWGPTAADQLLAASGCRWRQPTT